MATKARFRRPIDVPFPPDNPPTQAKAALGKTLFFDGRLSGSGLVSCMTCHNPGLAWQDGLPHSIGFNGQPLPRQTPTLLDLAWLGMSNWDGKRDGLEDQDALPFANPAIMGSGPGAAAARVGQLPGYRPLFKAAFGSEDVTSLRMAQALAVFQRTLVSGEAPFDRWVAGNNEAISAAAVRGFSLFTGKAHCASCHTGWRFTDDGFHDIGLPDADIGRGKLVPDEPSLSHAFKTPTLRNIDQRAPYMHDGSIGSLAAVISHYNAGFVQRPSLSPDVHRLALSADQSQDLLAFLHTLSSEDAPVAIPLLPSKDIE